MSVVLGQGFALLARGEGLRLPSSHALLDAATARYYSLDILMIL